MLTIDKVEALIGPIIEQAVKPHGSNKIFFSSGVDHDGENIIIAAIEYKKESSSINASSFLDAMAEAMKLLIENGDQRFLHVRHIHTEGEASDESFTHKRASRKQVAAS